MSDATIYNPDPNNTEGTRDMIKATISLSENEASELLSRVLHQISTYLSAKSMARATNPKYDTELLCLANVDDGDADGHDFIIGSPNDNDALPADVRVLVRDGATWADVVALLRKVVAWAEEGDLRDKWKEGTRGTGGAA